MRQLALGQLVSLEFQAVVQGLFLIIFEVSSQYVHLG